MFRKQPPSPVSRSLPTPACIWLCAHLLPILLGTSVTAVLYEAPSPSPASPLHSAAYTTSTSLFNHVIRHDRPGVTSSASLRLSGPAPTVASPPAHNYGPPLAPQQHQQQQHQQQQQQQLQHLQPPQPHPTIGNNLRYLTRSSPIHQSHLAAIYAPPPPRQQYPISVQYQPGNGAYRVGPSFRAASYNAAIQPGSGPYGIFGLPPLTGHLAGVADLTYIVDGRLLKQYLVMEDHDDDNTLDAFLNDPVNRNAYVPYLPHLNFGQRGGRPNLGFPAGIVGAGQPSRYVSQSGPPQFAQLRQPTYALGSGSLGFVRHPSGAIYLGSGSLGYINDQQQVDNLQSIRNRQTPGPGPLSFGHTPK